MKRINLPPDPPATKQNFVISSESVRRPYGQMSLRSIRVKSECGIGEDPVRIKMLLDEMIETLRSTLEVESK